MNDTPVFTELDHTGMRGGTKLGQLFLLELLSGKQVVTRLSQGPAPGDMLYAHSSTEEGEDTAMFLLTMVEPMALQLAAHPTTGKPYQVLVPYSGSEKMVTVTTAYIGTYCKAPAELTKPYIQATTGLAIAGAGDISRIC